MAKKVLLVSKKTTKQAETVAKAKQALKEEQSKLRSSQEAETEKAFVKLGEKVVRHWHLESVDELENWYQQVVDQVPYVEPTTNEEDDEETKEQFSEDNNHEQFN